MRSEARIAARLGRVVIGTGGLEHALADRPPLVISFGLCGGLDPAFPVGALLAGTGVTGPEGVLSADLGWTAVIEATGARPALFAGVSEIVASVADKSARRAQAGAGAADLESLAVAQAAKAAGTPFVILRAVSDGANDTLPRAAVAGFRPDGRTDLPAVLLGLARRPWELPGLIRTGRSAALALRVLERAAGRLAAPLDQKSRAASFIP